MIEIKYENKQALPEIIRVALPEEAQEIYREAYNQAWAATDTTLDEAQRASIAHQAGWVAVEQVYEHNEEKGQWRRKDEEGDQGLLGRLKDLLP